MKNKAFKYALISLALVITLVVSINLDRIKFGLSLVDIYRKTPKNEPNKILAKGSNNPPTVRENPLDKILEEDDEDYIKVENIEEENDVKPLDNLTEPKDDLAQIVSPNPKQDLIESKKSITERYNKEFISLQSEFENNLNNLISLAYTEFASGASSNSQLASKYLDQGVALEKSADTRFYTLLKSYEEELKKNSYDTSIVKEIESYYESFKKDRKSELVSKGMEIVQK